MSKLIRIKALNSPMKLIRLQVNERFRSLHEGFKIDFHPSYFDVDMDEFRPFCFAGLNGSGKSNVLEALASIFYHLECCHLKYLPENFKNIFKRTHCSPDAFELEYWIKPKFTDSDETVIEYDRVKVTKEKGKAPIIAVRYKEYDGSGQEFGSVESSAKDYLPDIVIGYSSGENEILSLPFFKTRFLHFDEYEQALVEKEEYEEPESSLIYIDESLSQSVLLANFLMQEEDVLSPIKKELELKGLSEFRMIIQLEEYFPDLNEGSKEKESNESKAPVSIISNVKENIEKLKACATCWFQDNETDHLFLDFKVDAITKEAFKDHFESPFELFRTFQILLTLNLFHIKKEYKNELYKSDSLYVAETIPNIASDERIFRFKQFYIKKENLKEHILLKAFSDGEHQFLHTMGICLMLQKRTALILLDEPETHFNPDWRSKFISILKSCLEVGDSNHLLRDILITTHSPFIISASLKENVKFLTKINGKAEVTEPNFNTFGSSILIILNKMFKRKEIPGLPMELIEKIEKKLEEGDRDFDSIYNELEVLGDSIQKRLLENYIIQLQNEKE